MDTVKKQAAMQAIETRVVRQQAIEKKYDRLLAVKLSYLKELETLDSSYLHAVEQFVHTFKSAIGAEKE